MATIDDFVGWVREDLPAVTVSFSDYRGFSAGFFFRLGAGYGVLAVPESEAEESWLSLMMTAHQMESVIVEGPLTRLTWHRCLAAIVANEAERMATQDARGRRALCHSAMVLFAASENAAKEGYPFSIAEELFGLKRADQLVEDEDGEVAK